MARLIFCLVFVAGLVGCKASGGFTGSLDAHATESGRADASCIRIYESGAYRLVENACPGADARRIALVDQRGERRFPSYDVAFTTWAWTEGCHPAQACAYQLKVRDGAITGFTYRFAINLSEGFIEVDVSHGVLRVIRKEIVDQPS